MMRSALSQDGRASFSGSCIRVNKNLYNCLSVQENISLLHEFFPVSIYLLFISIITFYSLSSRLVYPENNSIALKMDLRDIVKLIANLIS